MVVEVEDVIRQIESYLRDHPCAADTMEGISRWWLQGTAAAAPPQTVSDALERLVDRGIVCRRVAPGRRSVYSLASPQ